MRITRKLLEMKLGYICERSGLELGLDYAPTYGGYALFEPLKNGAQSWLWSVWDGRKSPKEMNAYLDGMDQAITLLNLSIPIEQRLLENISDG